MTIDEYYNKANSINLRDLVQETIIEQGDNIIFLNQYRLFNESKDADGDRLPYYKSIGYSSIKNKMNPSLGFGKPDLKNEGDFYRGFFVKVTKEEFELDSKDDKSGELKKKYGDKIFGLSEDHIEEFSKEFFNEALIENINKKMK